MNPTHTAVAIYITEIRRVNVTLRTTVLLLLACTLCVHFLVNSIIILYCIVLYCIVLYCIVLYCIILYYIWYIIFYGIII